MIILHNNKRGNNYLVSKILAKRFCCDTFAIEDGTPDLTTHEIIIFILSNVGDEELPQPMEDYLYLLSTRGKQYLVCELGNYFGLGNYCGCKKILFNLLEKLGWRRLSDVSIDSMPKLNINELNAWIESIQVICAPQKHQ